MIKATEEEEKAVGEVKVRQVRKSESFYCADVRRFTQSSALLAGYRWHRGAASLPVGSIIRAAGAAGAGIRLVHPRLS